MYTITITGRSGTGKTTGAQWIAETLKSKGSNAIVLERPSTNYECELDDARFLIAKHEAMEQLTGRNDVLILVGEPK